MPEDIGSVLAAAAQELATVEAEVVANRARQPLLVVCRTATGTGDIDHAFALDRSFRLVFFRCHFSGSVGKAPWRISLDSDGGAAFDAELYVIERAGTNADVNLRIPAAESEEPSPWTFQAGDSVRIRWTNPDPGNISWGIEAGLAVAS